jgi:DNA-directed RNA polymerase specialized sigma24 family protein
LPLSDPGEFPNRNDVAALIPYLRAIARWHSGLDAVEADDIVERALRKAIEPAGWPAEGENLKGWLERLVIEEVSLEMKRRSDAPLH